MKREDFLNRVSSALRSAELPDVSGPVRAPEISFTDPVTTFVAEAAAVNADVARVARPDLFQAIERVFESVGATSYVAWDELDLVAPGWDQSARDAGMERVDASVGTDPLERKKDHSRVGAVRVGVTSADCGVAASGSVVLCHGPGRPRSASLLVETHIVLLPAGRIRDSLSEALEEVRSVDSSNIAVITGPSRTGDIESILTLGVHGPRQLHIFVIE